MKIRKAQLNLLVDATIGIAMLVEMVTGFVLWLILPHGGYEGGRNPLYGQTFLITRDQWLSLHDWFALVITLGIVLHVAMHWRWITCMFRNMWREAFAPRAAEEPEQCAI